MTPVVLVGRVFSVFGYRSFVRVWRRLGRTGSTQPISQTRGASGATCLQLGRSFSKVEFSRGTRARESGRAAAVGRRARRATARATDARGLEGAEPRPAPSRVCLSVAFPPSAGRGVSTGRDHGQSLAAARDALANEMRVVRHRSTLASWRVTQHSAPCRLRRRACSMAAASQSRRISGRARRRLGRPPAAPRLLGARRRASRAAQTAPSCTCSQWLP